MNKTATGDFSTGDFSTGNYSTGDFSTGNCSTGYRSTGYRSTGNFSTGNYSTGNWSISHYSTGHFSTEDYSGYGAFDKPCTPEEWSNAEKPYFLYFNLTEWVESEEMTDEEKENNPSHKTTGGYLKVYEYQEAWKRSFDKQENKEEQIKLLESLPNFDYDKFVKISGIDYRKQDDATAQAIELLKKNGYKIIKD